MFGVLEAFGWCLGLSIFLSWHVPSSPHEWQVLAETNELNEGLATKIKTHISTNPDIARNW